MCIRDRLGPTPGSIEKINDSYRYKLTVKCRNDRRFRNLIRETLTLYEQEKLPGKATVCLLYTSPVSAGHPYDDG